MMDGNLKYWLFLVIASLFEAAWTFSLKFMTFSDLKKLRFNNFYLPDEGLKIVLPFLGYIVFGLINVYFFGVAMKKIPAATALAVWMACSLIFVKLAELLWFQQSISMAEAFFMMLILAGIIGMKVYAPVVVP